MADWKVSDGIVVIAETTVRALTEAEYKGVSDFDTQNCDVRASFQRILTSINYSEKILGLYRPDISTQKINDKLPEFKTFSILLKIEEPNLRLFLSASGRGGLFFRLRKDHPMNQILSVIWLGRMDLKTSILAQESVKSTYGIALCRGNYGVRVENACREQVRKSIGVKSLGYFSVEGIPKGVPVDKIIANFATKDIVVKPIKVIDGKWVLKIEDDFLGGENRMVLEWPDHGVKLACSRTERPKPKLITHTAEGAPQAKPESDKQEKVQQSGMESKLDKLLSMNETYFNKIENIEKNVEISNVRVAKIENNVANQNKNFEAIQKRFMQIETKLEILMPGLGQTEISGSDVDMSNGEYD